MAAPTVLWTDYQWELLLHTQWILHIGNESQDIAGTQGLTPVWPSFWLEQLGRWCHISDGEPWRRSTSPGIMGGGPEFSLGLLKSNHPGQFLRERCSMFHVYGAQDTLPDMEDSLTTRYSYGWYSGVGTYITPKRWGKDLVVRWESRIWATCTGPHRGCVLKQEWLSYLELAKIHLSPVKKNWESHKTSWGQWEKKLLLLCISLQGKEKERERKKEGQAKKVT